MTGTSRRPMSLTTRRRRRTTTLRSGKIPLSAPSSRGSTAATGESA